MTDPKKDDKHQIKNVVEWVFSQIDGAGGLDIDKVTDADVEKLANTLLENRDSFRCLFESEQEPPRLYLGMSKEKGFELYLPNVISTWTRPPNKTTKDPKEVVAFMQEHGIQGFSHTSTFDFPDEVGMKKEVDELRRLLSIQQ